MVELQSSDTDRRSVASGVFVGTFAAVLALIAAFIVMDFSLASLDAREARASAARLHQEGVALMRSGNAHEAADRFATAYSIQRREVRYAIALAQANLADGRVDEAEQTLQEILPRAATSGPANLTMAQVLMRTGRVREAKSFYHRAIYGQWSADSTNMRTRARLELVALLARRHESRELLAELLPLEAIASGSLAPRQLGALFLQADSPRRALAVFRTLLRDHPDDADAYAGLGESALALGNFVTARSDLLHASRLRPDDVGLRRRLLVADSVLAMAPNVRELSSAERSSRVRALLGAVLADRQRCVGAASDALPARATGEAMLAQPEKGSADSSTTNRMLGSAAAIWATRPDSCPASPTSEPLSLVMRSLGD